MLTTMKWTNYFCCKIKIPARIKFGIITLFSSHSASVLIFHRLFSLTTHAVPLGHGIHGLVAAGVLAGRKMDGRG
ncbi:hypothetical protein GGS26DRAFT_553587 [Hypomontagnella submonticulosa]|nr:hypothetical protein GGS26DRAFT_553587 [Hypomontagnella submonticulosa]